MTSNSDLLTPKPHQKIKEFIFMMFVYIFLIGGVGGLAVCQIFKLSEYWFIPAICILPMAFIWTYQFARAKFPAKIPTLLLKSIFIGLWAILTTILIALPEVAKWILLSPLIIYGICVVILIPLLTVFQYKEWFNYKADFHARIASGAGILVAVLIILAAMNGYEDMAMFGLKSGAIVAVCGLLMALAAGTRGLFKSRDYDVDPILGISFLNNMFVGVGSWVAILIFCFIGFNVLFGFIPDDWGGYDEDGGWHSHRTTLATICSVAVSVLVIIVSSKYLEQKKVLELYEKSKKTIS